MASTLLEMADILAAGGLILRTERLDLASEGNVPVTGIDSDSRFSQPSHLFACKGKAFSPAYLQSAIEASAVAYLCEEGVATSVAEIGEEAGIPAIVVSDIRRAMGDVAATAWGHPDRDYPVIGLTGTKGKSTTAYMLRAILDGQDGERHTGILGSIDTYDGIEDFESVNTTPEAPDMWRHLANVRDSGLSYMTMEVSSQGLKYDRVTELELAVACFLNLGRDHISPIEHPDFEDYFQSKLRIFDHARRAIVNLDSDRADEVMARATGRCERVVTVSARGDEGVEADVVASGITSERGTVSFTVRSRRGERRMRISMPGLFNVDNALIAIAVAEMLGVPDADIAYGLSHVRAPGRMELLETDDERLVALVDYAHNKLSYQRFFSSVTKEFPGWRVIALLGAPGDKAQERRFELPQEASKWADLLVYSEEDPAHEDPADICDEMVRNTPEGQRCCAIVNRPDAISYCVQVARGMLADGAEGVVVCLLAKGDETRQHEGDRFVPCETDGDIFMREIRRTARTDG